MHLRGQGRERGYTLAAVLVGVAVMSIVMSALLPVWRQQLQREKEAELIFRGEQYARAIYLYQVKNGGQYPPSIDVLVQGRYLRKKYKDPMTEDGEFQPLFLGANQPGQPGGQPGQPGRGNQPPGASQPVGGARGGGGIVTVRSKSTAPSIRIYNGATRYNEWHFQYNAQGRGRGAPQGTPGGGSQQGVPGMGGAGRGGRGNDAGRGARPGGGQRGGQRGGAQRGGFGSPVGGRGQ